MKIWAITKKNNKIRKDKIYEAPIDLEALIYQACEDFDIGKPLILTKNRHELEEFRRTVFYAADFMEPIAFDTFEVEIIDEDKEKQKNRI
ncbi:MAG: hypothetical protein AB1Z19_00740 [Eubacteriales bacterium]